MDTIGLLQVAVLQVTDALLALAVAHRDLQVAEAQIAAVKKVILDGVTQYEPEVITDIVEAFADINDAIQRFKTPLGP